jgi:hypothetical protein
MDRKELERIDRYIAEDILKFDCFNTIKGTIWYETHYNMGNWNYCKNTQHTFELIERLFSIEPFKLEIKMQENNYQCTITTTNKIYLGVKSDLVSYAICDCILKYKA